MLTNYTVAKQELYKLIPLSSKQRHPGRIGLSRMVDLLERLDNPHRKFPSVHVAGTAGKGSTSYLIAKIIKEAGYKVGLHTSPHLQTMRERLIINDKLISERKFAALVNKIRLVVEEMGKTGKYGKPSYFEALLGLTFLYFGQENVDLAVIEAGLGGRFDGTNVLRPEVAVLTNIGLDHTEILGKSKQAILKDKMQIIKPGCRVVITGIRQKFLLKILENHCQKRKVPLLTYGQDFRSENIECKKNQSRFSYLGKAGKVKNINLSLPGSYQIGNACLAIATCLSLKEAGTFCLSDKQMKKALTSAFFPGRLETISKKPLIILDGAHNEDKTKALVKSIKKIYPGEKPLIIFGVKKDKNVTKMIKALELISKQFILTQFGQATDLGFKLNFPVKELLVIVKKLISGGELYWERDCHKALRKALQIVLKTKKPILLTGSLYLVGEARQFFKLKPNKKINCYN